MSTRYDVAIVGGGVVGLWTRAAAFRAGLSTVLVDRGPLGAGQTIASQGILHAGLKYALSPAGREAARQVGAAQDAWAAALAGSGIPDLRGVRVVCERFCMWALPGVLSSFTALGAAAVLQSGARKLPPGERKGAFAGAPENFGVWEVPERAVDSASLVRELAAAPGGPIIAGVGEVSLDVRAAESGGDARVVEKVVVGGREIRADAWVFCAGVGNEDLLRQFGVNPDEYSQRRPLHMVMARRAPAELFGHCIRPGSDKPRLTVTSSRMAGTGEIVWYLGGDLAESGVGRSAGEQIELARREVAACLPWLELSGVAWSTLRIDRAEGLTPRGGRPDGPVCVRFGNAVAVWPTKLVLAPAAAEMALAEVRRIRGAASAGTRDTAPGEAPPIAPAPWEDAAWS